MVNELTSWILVMPKFKLEFQVNYIETEKEHYCLNLKFELWKAWALIFVAL